MLLIARCRRHPTTLSFLKTLYDTLVCQLIHLLCCPPTLPQTSLEQCKSLFLSASPTCSDRALSLAVADDGSGLQRWVIEWTTPSPSPAKSPPPAVAPAAPSPSPSPTPQVATVPAPPTGVSALGAADPGSWSVVSWKVPSSDGGSSITGYMIDCISAGGMKVPQVVAGADATSVFVKDLLLDVPYTCTVTAQSNLGLSTPSHASNVFFVDDFEDAVQSTPVPAPSRTLLVSGGGNYGIYNMIYSCAFTETAVGGVIVSGCVDSGATLLGRPGQMYQAGSTVFVANSLASTVVACTLVGNLLQNCADTGGTGFNSPVGLAVSGGYMYVSSDDYNSEVSTCTLSGRALSSCTSSPGPSFGFFQLTQNLLISSSGELYC